MLSSNSYCSAWGTMKIPLHLTWLKTLPISPSPPSFHNVFSTLAPRSVVHNFSRLLRSQLEGIELSIWQVKTCCLLWYRRWQLIRRLPWHVEESVRVCCRQPIHNCFRCYVLAIILDTSQKFIQGSFVRLSLIPWLWVRKVYHIIETYRWHHRHHRLTNTTTFLKHLKQFGFTHIDCRYKFK